MKNDEKIILALYPNTRGLGYACVEMPGKLFEYGIITVRPIANTPILSRITRFMEFFKPTLVVVRDCESPGSTKSDRLKKFMEALSKLAAEQNIPIHYYTKQQIKDVFEIWGANTKDEIAKKIIEWFPELIARAPKIRKPWMDEDYNMGIFDALALAFTHGYLTE